MREERPWASHEPSLFGASRLPLIRPQSTSITSHPGLFYPPDLRAVVIEGQKPEVVRTGLKGKGDLPALVVEPVDGKRVGLAGGADVVDIDPAAAIEGHGGGVDGEVAPAVGGNLEGNLRRQLVADRGVARVGITGHVAVILTSDTAVMLRPPGDVGAVIDGVHHVKEMPLVEAA